MKFSEHPFQIRALAYVFGGCVLIVASANAYSWPQALSGLLGWFVAALAVLACVAAFFLWEVLVAMFRAGRWGKGCGLSVVFLLVVGFDAIGVHNAIHYLTAPQRAQAEEALEADYQERLAPVRAARAEIQAEIAVHQARIDAVAPPDRNHGPIKSNAETARWNAETASDRAAIAAREAQLAELPRDVPRGKLDWLFTAGPWMAAGALEFLVAFGLPLLGVEVAPLRSMQKPPAAPEQPPIRTLARDDASPPRRRRVQPLNLAYDRDADG